MNVSREPGNATERFITRREMKSTYQTLPSLLLL